MPSSLQQKILDQTRSVTTSNKFFILILLLASIVFTSYLTLSFKVVGRFGIPLFPTIVFNYLTCVVTGSVVNGFFPLNAGSFKEEWIVWAGIMGILFITLFNIIGFTAQKIGVAVASVANKLSLVIPFAFSVYLYNEQATWIKIAGIALALVAVFFTCLPPERAQGATGKKLSPALMVGLPAILFLGSGLLDALVKYVEHTYLNPSNSDAYLIASFATAGLIGSVILAGMYFTRKATFDYRSIIAGIAIGIPNYFSIWFLVKVLKLYANNSSAIIPINNMGIVLLSSLVAALLFKERLSAFNWVGIFLSLVAIALIAFG